MKTILTAIALIFISSVYGQTIYVGQTSNTWYVNAPTSGCNGIWAIDVSQWGCSIGCSYASASPAGCLTTTFPSCDSVIADTVYLKLCSLPCNIIASCMSGQVYVCGTGTPMAGTTGINESALKQSQIYPNPSPGEFTLELSGTNNELCKIDITDIQGRLIYGGTSSDKKINLNLDVENGLYLVHIINTVNNETIIKKLIIEN